MGERCCSTKEERLEMDSGNHTCPRCKKGTLKCRDGVHRPVWSCSLSCGFMMNRKPSGLKCEHRTEIGKCGAPLTETKSGKFKCSDRLCPARKKKIIIELS